MKTHLNIIIHDKDCRFLSITDLSYYNNELPIEQPYFYITVPGFNYPYSFLYTPNQTNTYTAFDLGLTNNATGENLPNLPDGVYIIKQQICPHNELYNEYYYMRVCILLNLYYDKFCKIKKLCNITEKELNEEIKKLNKIKFFIDATKYSAENCGNINDAMAFYKKAEELLNDKCNNC